MGSREHEINRQFQPPTPSSTIESRYKCTINVNLNNFIRSINLFYELFNVPIFPTFCAIGKNIKYFRVSSKRIKFDLRFGETTILLRLINCSYSLLGTLRNFSIKSEINGATFSGSVKCRWCVESTVWNSKLGFCLRISTISSKYCLRSQ